MLLHQRVIPASESFWVTCQWAKVKAVVCMNAMSSSMGVELHVPIVGDSR